MSESVQKKRSIVLRVFYFFFFVLRFTRELVMANVAVAKTVLFASRESLEPDFVEYPTAHLGELELVLLTHCITLTPGTTSVHIAEDRSRVVVHALDGADHDAVRVSIREGLEEPLLRWTR